MAAGLQADGHDVATAPQGTPDEKVQQKANAEDRVVVTCERRGFQRESHVGPIRTGTIVLEDGSAPTTEKLRTVRTLLAQDGGKWNQALTKERRGITVRREPGKGERVVVREIERIRTGLQRR